MRIITAQDLEAVMTFRDLQETLRRAFRVGAICPSAFSHSIVRPIGFEDGTLRVSSAWHDFAEQGTVERGFVGTRVETYLPSADDSLPENAGVYLLQSGKSGTPLALIDGQALTLWKLAATSGLASSYLSREDSARLLILGSGTLALHLIESHLTVRPIKEILVWDRSYQSAEKLAAAFQGRPYSIRTTHDLGGAIRGADIICSTLAGNSPFIKAEWLPVGCHLDLVGATQPKQREADDDVICSSRLFIDSYESALSRAGDLIMPLETGLVTRQDIAADLHELCQGDRAGRRFYEQITLFKSVGTALADLAVAGHAFLRV